MFKVPKFWKPIVNNIFWKTTLMDVIYIYLISINYRLNMAPIDSNILLKMQEGNL